MPLYLQVLLARPVPNAFQGKDVILPEFVVHIFIPYISEMFTIRQKDYLIIDCIILMVLPLFLTSIILCLQILVAQPLMIAFLVKRVLLTRFVVGILID